MVEVRMKESAQHRDIHRKNAYAEHRLIMATDRYITARTTTSKERARKWIYAWRALRISRHK